MKIRGYFVTNSSSTSFILTAKEDIFKVNIDHFQKTGEKGIVQLLTFLRNKLESEGNKTKIGNDEVLFTVKKFKIGKSIKVDDINPDDIVDNSHFLLVYNIDGIRIYRHIPPQGNLFLNLGTSLGIRICTRIWW